jgi:predicted transcriptional regulator
MRAELGQAVAGVLAGIDTDADVSVTEDEADLILRFADVVTLARTGVQHDYRGDVIDAHAPEMPTRFAKQLTQILRGGLALGIHRDHMMRIVARCAADSIPPLRLTCLLDLQKTPDSSTHEVRQRIDKPRATADRTLQALHMLGLATCWEEPCGDTKTRWRYSLASDVDLDALTHLELSQECQEVHTPR